MRFLKVALIVAFISIPAALWGKAPFNVIYPPDRVWVNRSKITIVGIATSPAIKTIRINGVAVLGGRTRKVIDGAFSATIQLKPGLNNITFSSSGFTLKRSIFLIARGKRPPRGFRRFYVHRYLGELKCRMCHRLGRKRSYKERIIPTPAGCSTSKCHPNIARKRYIHGPVGAKVCICCHNPHGSLLKYELERKGGDLCYACHQAKKRAFAQKFVHSPVKGGECSSCHDPHQSNLKFQLKGKSLQDLCFQCHDRSIIKHKYLHGPVGVGDCVACHKPHASPYPKLLIKSPIKGEVCFVCHQQRLAEFKRKHIHKPVEEGCEKCHESHGSEYKGQLTEPEPKLCEKCHRKTDPTVFIVIKRSKYKHEPVVEGKCTSCHTPHSSEERKQLWASLNKLCLKCHVDLADYIRDSKFLHGPVKTGDCDACHKPHGSQFAFLLNKYFPPEFYTPYKANKYDLCFECHNRDIARDKRTTTLTDFRNGSLNLHYVHVHREKGRSCKACHDAHASSQAKHIRLEVPFGAWSYPIQFTKTKTGGSCVVGCHRPLSYDRINPVRYEERRMP